MEANAGEYIKKYLHLEKFQSNTENTNMVYWSKKFAFCLILAAHSASVECFAETE